MCDSRGFGLRVNSKKGAVVRRSAKRPASRPWVTVTAAVCLILVGCASSSYQMGTPIAASQHVGSAAAPPRASPVKQDSKTAAESTAWSEKWRQVQNAPESVDWVDHFRICAIKYRFRVYDELFRCLELFERRVAQMNPSATDAETLKRYAPVWVGWMSAAAYAELGSPEVALRSADAAWNALPPEYHEAHLTYRVARRGHDPFRDMSKRLTGGFAAFQNDTIGREDNPMLGRDNPAALDMMAETVAMSLAAERALLHASLDQPEEAKSALADLKRWEIADLEIPGALAAIDKVFTVADPAAWFVGDPLKGLKKPFKVKAELLSLGPLFALHEDSEVVSTYRTARADAEKRLSEAQRRQGSAFKYIAPWTYWSFRGLEKGMGSRDIRLFEVALEDASNALIYAESLARTGQTEEARGVLDMILALPEVQEMGSLYWATLYERAGIALHDGQRNEAVSLLGRSADAIERTRSTIALEAAKIGFVGDKQAVYGKLVELYAQSGDWEHAFQMAERAKARALVDLLAQQQHIASPTGADERVRQLLASATTTDNSLALPIETDVSRNLSSIQVSRADLVQAAPEAASLVSVQQVPITQIAAHLAPEETLVDYFLVGEDLYAFLLDKNGVRGIKLSGRALDKEVRAFRSAIERRDADATEKGRSLYERLIRPLQPELRTEKLVISPHGALHYVPFGALSDGEEYLLDRYSVRLIPSAAALVYIKTDRPQKVGRVLALGNPDLGDPRLDLPNAQVEAVNVAAMFPASKALVRADATKTAVKNLAGGFAILHFATHGSFNADTPMSSGLYLAKGEETDGVLTVADLYGLRLDSELVTLSACQTGLGKVANGDDVIGLTRGFLYAGARSIVASLWQVNDAATEQLMLSFYHKLQDHPAREALRLAQIETRQSYPDPVLWGAFQIVGSAD